MSASRSLAGLLITLMVVGTFLSGCRLISGEVLCRRDRDCPTDAGVPFCTSWDAGIGTCTDDDEFRGNTLPLEEEDAGTSPPPTGDGGVPDGGPGGFPSFP